MPRKLPAAPKELEGKSAPEPEIIRWVSRHIDHPKPDPAGCPDPFAWTLLRQCRNEPEFVGFFIEKLWSKLIPSRSQIDHNKAGEDYDGKVTVSLIERIQRMGEKKKPKPPEPEPIPDAFADFDPEEEK